MQQLTTKLAWKAHESCGAQGAILHEDGQRTEACFSAEQRHTQRKRQRQCDQRSTGGRDLQ